MKMNALILSKWTDDFLEISASGEDWYLYRREAAYTLQEYTGNNFVFAVSTKCTWYYGERVR